MAVVHHQAQCPLHFRDRCSAITTPNVMRDRRRWHEVTGSTNVSEYRRHGLYYPYFHFRDERWLKTAALYWPKIVRIVPEGYQTRDSETVRSLEGDFIVRQPPGYSVDAIAPMFLDLVAKHGDELRAYFNRAY